MRLRLNYMVSNLRVPCWTVPYPGCAILSSSDICGFEWMQRFLHSSMWLGLQTVSSLVGCPLLKSVLYSEVPLYCHPKQKYHTCNFWLSQVLTGYCRLTIPTHIPSVCLCPLSLSHCFESKVLNGISIRPELIVCVCSWSWS